MKYVRARKEKEKKRTFFALSSLSSQTICRIFSVSSGLVKLGNKLNLGMYALFVWKIIKYSQVMSGIYDVMPIRNTHVNSALKVKQISSVK